MHVARGLPLASTSVGAGDRLQLLGFNMTPIDLRQLPQVQFAAFSSRTRMAGLQAAARRTP
jgi:hypothetical protein